MGRRSGRTVGRLDVSKGIQKMIFTYLLGTYLPRYKSTMGCSKAIMIKSGIYPTYLPT